MNVLKEIKDYEVLPGTDIEEAVKESIKLAEYYDCVIRFMFNSVEMMIYNFSDCKEKVNYYFRRLKENNP